jgi:mycothiol synthase
LADIPETGALIDACNLALGETAFGAAAQLGVYWNDPDRDLADEDWLVVASDGRVAAYLQLYAYAPFTTFEFEGYVHPDHTGRGLGAYLLEMIEARARRDLHRAPAGERVVLQTDTPSANLRARRLFEQHGFKHFRDGLRMQIDFDGPPPAPEWPEGITARRLVRGQDEYAVYEMMEEAFADHWGYEPMTFEEFVRFRIEIFPDYDPALCILAYDGERLVGASLCRSGHSSPGEVGWVGYIGVAPAYRGRGVGMALLRESFGELYRRGKTGVGLGVDGASLTGADRLYRRAGMRVTQRSFLYEKELRPAGG